MDFEERCETLLGKHVRITFRDGSPPMVGTCVGYTRAVDNEPEIAEIDIDTGVAGVYYGLMENEVESIEELPEQVNEDKEAMSSERHEAGASAGAGGSDESAS